MTVPVKIDQSKPLIRDLKNSVPIEQTLVLVFAKMGLKPENWPSKDPKFNEWQLLITHVRENYRTVRAEEIKIAFELALKGRFEVDTQHYQNFSCEYFSRVMNAYLKWKVPFSRQQKQIETKEKPIDWTHFYKKYEDCKNDKYEFNGLEWLYYQHLESIGIEIMPLEEKKELFKQVSTEVQKKLRETEDKHLWRIQKECRRRAFKEFILNCAFNNVDLEKLIKEKL